MGSYLGDLSKTQRLRDLFQFPVDSRDDAWRAEFLEDVPEASFACGDPQVIHGPDGFPYFQLNTPEPNKEFQCYVVKHMITDFLLSEGFGVVINASKGNPDWVFSYGDIVNYHLQTKFYSDAGPWNPGQKTEVMKGHEQALIGQPSESVLPDQTRSVIRKFLESLGLTDVKLLLMNRRKSGGELVQELVFNLTPGRFQKHEHFEGVMRSISWYLPRHYSFVGMEETSFKDGFLPL